MKKLHKYVYIPHDNIVRRHRIIIFVHATGFIMYGQRTYLYMWCCYRMLARNNSCDIIRIAGSARFRRDVRLRSRLRIGEVRQNAIRPGHTRV